MKGHVPSALREISIATEVSKSDFATAALAPRKTKGKRLKFPSDQRWCKLLNQKIEFVDQTLDTVRSFNSLSDPEADSVDYPFPSLERQDADKSPCNDGDTQLQESSNLDHTTLPFHQHPDQLPQLVFEEYTPIATGHIDSDWYNTGYTPQGTYASYGDRHQLGLPTCTLKQSEAELVRYFFSGFSDAFDLGDPDRAFSSWLSARVLQYPRLLESVLTTASKHSGKEVIKTACLDQGEPSSDHTQRLPGIDSITDFSLRYTDSVAGLLSRFKHTMEAKSSISTPTLGQASTMDERTEPSEQADLPEAAWWASLRLEVYSAVVTQTPFTPTSDHLYADKRFVPVDDKDWANLMLLHLADIIRYCFSESKDTDNYIALLKDLTTWSNSKPDSFDPIYTCSHPEGRALPDVWVYNESVAAGLQYYHLGRMLLISHDPRLPKIGPAKKKEMKRIEHEMKNDAKLVCAIAEGMGEDNPTYLTACMAIALVGDLFDSRAEQDALLGVLDNATDRFGWPTSYIRDHLKEAWGWV
ncbi:Ff.00g017810.m01.CDS01 [Fusarium sp. VM40]|nr:Ff.00g017810.m01.CDS01 [Fusarium sp. VM40]